jgi:hypothetical protein
MTRLLLPLLQATFFSSSSERFPGCLGFPVSLFENQRWLRLPLVGFSD